MQTFVQYVENNQLYQIILNKLARHASGSEKPAARGFQYATGANYTDEGLTAAGISHEEWMMAKKQGILVKTPDGHWQLTTTPDWLDPSNVKNLMSNDYE